MEQKWINSAERHRKADDLVQALWKKLREQKIEMIKQLELDLEAA